MSKSPSSLPPGWRVVRFGDVVRNVDVAERKPLQNGLERYVGLEHLDPESLHIKRWGLIEDGTTFTRKFIPGQVLFGKRRAYQRKVAVAEFSGVCSGDILVFEPKNEHLRADLLPFIVQSEGFFQHALGTSAGSLSPRTRWRDLEAYEFALPPLDEQRRIAEMLWAADETIGAQITLIDANEGVLAAIRSEKLGFRNGHQTTYLADLCENNGIKIGPFGSQLHASDYVLDGVPVIMPSDMADDNVNDIAIARVSPEKADQLKEHRILPGDILLPRRGDLGKRAFIRAEQQGWLCGTGSIRIRTRRDVPSRGVFHALAAPETVAWLEKNAVGTTMPNLNATIVSNIPLSLPKMCELEHIAAVLDDLQALIRTIHENLQVLKELKMHLTRVLLEK